MPPAQWPNWYATEWPSATAVAREALARWDDLEAETLRFRDALYGSTLPEPVLDAAGANISILKSPTALRLEDGTFYGWEGCHPAAGSCEGSCTHVWNYQQALPFLFPALERSMRVADYAHNIDDAGGMSFRLSLPLGTHYRTERPCADGQFGGILKLYRDWKLSGDLEWLRGIWPLARSAASSTPGAPTTSTAGIPSGRASSGVASITPSTWSCSGPTRGSPASTSVR